MVNPSKKRSWWIKTGASQAYKEKIAIERKNHDKKTFVSSYRGFLLSFYSLCQIFNYRLTEAVIQYILLSDSYFFPNIGYTVKIHKILKRTIMRKMIKSITAWIITISITAITNFQIVNAMQKVQTEPQLTATAAVLIDADSGLVIYEKNMNEKRFPASITKIITALLTIKAADGDYSRRIQFTNEALSSLPSDSSNMGMREGESLSLEQALYGLMLPSANEVANALALDVSGSIEEFVVLMNEEAERLGAVNSHFMNPHGLHNTDHYTTALDMALIMKEAVQYDEFLKVISTKRVEIPQTEKRNTFEIVNTNKMIQAGSYNYEFAVGGKTGYTDEAGHTLVSYAQKGDRKLISVVLQDVKNILYKDSIVLLDYGFSKFNRFEFTDSKKFTETIKEFDNLTVRAKDDLIVNLPLPLNSTFKEEIALLDVTLPIEKDEPVASLNIKFEDKVVASVPLLSMEDKPSRPEISQNLLLAIAAAENYHSNQGDGSGGSTGTTGSQAGNQSNLGTNTSGQSNTQSSQAKQTASNATPISSPTENTSAIFSLILLGVIILSIILLIIIAIRQVNLIRNRRRKFLRRYGFQGKNSEMSYRYR